jgi:putative transposase
MADDRDFLRRHSIRLQGFDYTQDGAYFVTICTQDKQLLFGKMIETKVELCEAGRMIDAWWKKLPSKFPNVKLDAHVIMPNHFHGIVSFVGADLRVCPEQQTGAHGGAPLRSQIERPTFFQIVQWFKSITTHEYARGVRDQNWPGFRNRLWQRNYYEHVIRNDDELNRARQYVIQNPQKWDVDPERT